MRSITKQLDMSPGAVSPVVHVSQYDSDFTIVFTLYCTDGTFTLESGTTAEVRGTKKSGTGYSATATVNISAKTVTVTGHKQMTAVAGDNIYEITLYKGSKELNSINFILAVERAAMDQDTVTDETTIREFGELKTYIEDVKADTAASASAAQASQTAAAASAQCIRTERYRSRTERPERGCGKAEPDCFWELCRRRIHWPHRPLRGRRRQHPHERCACPYRASAGRERRPVTG